MDGHSTRVLVPLADGVEEMEAVIAIDVLRRARWDVVVAATGAREVTASRGVHLVADTLWDQVNPDPFDMLLIPGGAAGVGRLARDPRVLGTVQRFDASGKWLAAVCAGPLVFQAAGILAGRRVTCHPGAAGDLTATPRLNDRVVVEGRLVTSQGPGTSFEFALTLVSLIEGAHVADELARSMVLKG